MTELTKIVPPKIEEITGEADWSPAEMPFSTTGGSSFVGGDPEGMRLWIWLLDDQEVGVLV